MSTSAGIAAMKMTGMKSFVKKWQILANVGKVHTYAGSCNSDMEDDENEAEFGEEYHEHHDINGGCNDAMQGQHGTSSRDAASSTSRGPRTSLNAVPEGFAAVFVGRARRQYVVHARHLQHPLFKALQQRSETSGINQSLGLTLGCEVVLFEHLLWMLDSDDPALHTDSIHELAELYMPASEYSSSLQLHVMHQD